MKKFRVVILATIVVVVFGAMASLLGFFESVKALPEQKNVESVNAPAGVCTEKVLVEGSQWITATFPPSDFFHCLELTAPLSGTFQLDWGYAFITPVNLTISHDGAIIEELVLTGTMVPGELAPRLAGWEMEVLTDTTFVFQPTLLESGSEIGMQINMTAWTPPPPPPPPITATFTYTENFQKQWFWPLGTESGVLEVTWEQDGEVTLEGTTFYSLTVNGQEIETYPIEGEQAFGWQVETTYVAAGEVWVFRVEGNEFWFKDLDYGPKIYPIFLPIVSKPAEPTIEVIELNTNGTSGNTAKASWPGAVLGQVYCLRAILSGTTPNTTVSGYFFGESDSFTLVVDDSPKAVAVTIGTGGNASTFNEIGIPSAKTVEGCVTATGATEIGFSFIDR